MDFRIIGAIIASLHGIVLSAVVFLHRRGNRYANRFLALLLFLFSLRLLEVSLYRPGFFQSFPHLLFLTDPFPFLLGVLLYLYARSVVTDQRRISRTDLFMLTPCLLHYAYLTPFYLRNSGEKLDVLQLKMSITTPVFAPEYFVVQSSQILYVLVFVLITISLVGRYSQGLEPRERSTKGIQVTWLRNLSIGFAVLLVAKLIHTLENLGFEIGFPSNIVFMSLATVLIFVIGYYALQQPEILSTALLSRQGAKYERSSLSQGKAAEISRKLLELMETSKPYLNPDLRMPDVAAMLSVSPNHLSQVINEHFHLSFPDYVNSLRVKEAQRRLADPAYDHLNIYAIGLDAGFTNKSSFNSAFRKITGTSPSQFKRLHRRKQ